MAIMTTLCRLQRAHESSSALVALRSLSPSSLCSATGGPEEHDGDNLADLVVLSPGLGEGPR